MTQLGMIPPELRALPQWVVWRTVERDGNPTKPPFNPHNGTLARTHDQEGKTYKDRPQDTWSDFETAAQTCRKSRAWEGVGFVFTTSDPYVGVDIDDCIDAGRFNDQAKMIVPMLSSYTERSPSRTGVHVILRGVLPAGGRRKGSVELYDQARYFTFTGDIPNKCSSVIEDRQAELEDLHRMLFGVATENNGYCAPAPAPFLLPSDGELLEKARCAKNGGLFCALYDYGVTATYEGDDSRADLALCDLLSFWTGPDGDRIDRLFRGSALYRRKWDRADYSRRTIDKALAGRTAFYDVHYGSNIPLNGYKPTSAPQTDATGAAAPPVAEDETIDTEHTERRSSDRVIARHGHHIRHAYGQNSWYVWSGNRWTANAEDKTLAIIDREIRSAYQEVVDVDDEALRKRKVKALLRTETSRYIHGVLSLMRHHPDTSVQPTDFDIDPFLLNCGNGTVNLLSGTLRPHRQEDMLSKLAGCGFYPEAKCPLWMSFVERVLPDAAVRKFMQRACGYALTGLTNEQCFFFLFGSGANGKSVFITTILEILGEYGQQANAELLLSNSKHKEMSIAQMFGKRFVATIEVDQGRRMAEGLVKQMTGSDKLSGKLLYQNAFEFTPSHKIFLAANHRPVIQGTDHAIWRRVMLVPFTETIAKEDQDPDLTRKLREELPGILNWCVRGCLEWQQTENGRQLGLQPPAAVLAATEEYREEQDMIGKFMEDCCHTVDQEGFVRAGTLNEAYNRWCATIGEKAISSTAFGREMSDRGFAVERDRGGKIRRGISLNDHGNRVSAPRSGMFREDA